MRSETQRLIWSFIDDSSVANVKGISRWLDARINLVTATKEAFAKEDEPLSHLAQSMNAGNFDLVYVGTKDGRMIQSKPTDLPAGELASADINGDGRDEALLTMGHTLFCIGSAGDPAQGRVLWSVDLPAPVGPPVIADVDGSGEATIVLVGSDGYVYGIR